MKEEIERYEPKQPEVVAIGTQRVRAFVGDAPAQLGHVLWVGEEPTRIVTLAGARRVEAIAFDTSSMSIGESVRVGEQVAGWPAPLDGAVPLAELRFVPGRTIDSALPPHRAEALKLGAPVDRCLPVVRHGVTMLLDTGAPDETFDRLYQLAERQLGERVAAAERRLDVPRQVLGSNGLALAVAAEWAREGNDCLIIEAEPFDLDELLDPLRGATVLVRVKLRDGLEILAESLDLGHCDTQLLVRDDGSIDLGRSESRLTDTTRFGRLAEVREQLAIFGAHDVDPDDVALVREAESLERSWLG